VRPGLRVSRVVAEQGRSSHGLRVSRGSERNRGRSSHAYGYEPAQLEQVKLSPRTPQVEEGNSLRRMFAARASTRKRGP
jgi:hypothetical protein